MESETSVGCRLPAYKFVNSQGKFRSFSEFPVPAFYSAVFRSFRVIRGYMRFRSFSESFGVFRSLSEFFGVFRLIFFKKSHLYFPVYKMCIIKRVTSAVILS